MRLYQIIMKVPDDFNSDDLQLSAQYKDPIEICSEGFIGPPRMVECVNDATEDAESTLTEDTADKEVEDLSFDFDEGGSDQPEDTEPEIKEEPSGTEIEGEEVDDSSESTDKESVENNED